MVAVGIFDCAHPAASNTKQIDTTNLTTSLHPSSKTRAHMRLTQIRDDTTTRRPHQHATLNQVWLIGFLDGVRRLSDRSRHGLEPDRSATK
jgi:hypothetical protein